MKTKVYFPDALFQNGQWLRGVPLVVSADGIVLPSSAAGPEVERVPLPGKALLPGFVNGHSHAFQRAIRGRTEFLASGHEHDDFWSWREAMYAVAAALTPEQLYVVSRQAFLEMALVGVTTVGEFHYLHHQPDGSPYADEHELSLQVIRAAREVGLRIVLLRVGYARAGFQVPPNPRQRRFIDLDVDAFLRRTVELQARTQADALVTVGAAPHSVRAVPKSWLEAVSQHWKLAPLHIHVSEQPAEIRACLAEHQRRPVELLDELGLLGPHFTAVHAIHLNSNEVARLGQSQSTVCACPSTERNLGDGIVEADKLLDAGARISLGSDSQAHIDLLQEAQQLEGHLRLLRQRRNILSSGAGDFNSLATRLLRFLTVDGHRSLGLTGGTLSVGEPADFVAFDLAHPAILGAPDALLAQAVLGGSAAAVSDVFVAGRRIVHGGQHVLAAESARAFVQTVASVFC